MVFLLIANSKLVERKIDKEGTLEKRVLSYLPYSEILLAFLRFVSF